MLRFLRKKPVKAAPDSGRLPAGVAGRRAYAIGDIHGELGLLEELLAMIEVDRQADPSRRDILVFLGDLIDRGPSSSGVVEYLRTRDHGTMTPVFLAGNHEEIFLRILHGETHLMRSWLGVGGRECARSYGVGSLTLMRGDEEAIARELRETVPQAHIDFLEGFADSFSFGDYLFVHAGIRPGVPIAEQDPSDLRWIREEFLTDATPHGVMVVHGHTVVNAPEERSNRIGIDTGAYMSGRLTALCIEDAGRRYLATGVAVAGHNDR